MKKYNNQSGQIIVVLLLIVVVVLAIGLSVVGRSNTEILTSSKIENSARAFSAAEAGIEHAIAVTLNSSTKIPFTNGSYSNVVGTYFPNPSVLNLEQPNIGGSDPNNSTPYAFAQFWFADPKTLKRYPTSPNDKFYLYFGNSPVVVGTQPKDYPAVEVHVIYKTNRGPNPGYNDAKYYFDSEFGIRPNPLDNSLNNVFGCDSGGNPPLPILTNIPSSGRNFLCRVTLPPSGSFPWGATDDNNYPLLIRVRVLYSPKGQNVAVGPPGTQALLPPQIYLYNSSGISGDSQRTVQVTRDTDVMPYLFDFALYSDNGASK